LYSTWPIYRTFLDPRQVPARPGILLSWNFKHLANVRREALIAAINRTEGHLQTLRLLSPLEVEDETQD
jgi:hypothetical protein